MARKKSYNARSYYNRASGYVRSYARRGWNSRPVTYMRRTYYRKNTGIGNQHVKVYPDLSVGAGFVTGMTYLDNMVPGQVWLAGAALPLGGSIGRRFRNFCGGVILGELASQLTGVKIPIGTAPTAKTTNVTTTTSVAALYSA